MHLVDSKNLANNPRYIGNVAREYVSYYYSLIESLIRAFDWYRNRWPYVTLSGVMAVILRSTEWNSRLTPCAVNYSTSLTSRLMDLVSTLRRCEAPRSLQYHIVGGQQRDRQTGDHTAARVQ